MTSEYGVKIRWMGFFSSFVFLLNLYIFFHNEYYRYKNQVCVKSVDFPCQFTFQELDNAANLVSNWVKEIGLKPKDVVSFIDFLSRRDTKRKGSTSF